MENKITIEQATKQISEGFSSIYSKDDVLHLLSVLETGGEFEITDDMVSELSVNIADSLQSEGANIIDDYELSMEYKEVLLESIDFSETSISRVVKDVLKTYIDNNKNN